MKKKKSKLIFFVLFLVILLGVYFITSYFYKKSKDETKQYEDYTPQEEISEQQYRETIVSLYFLNKNSKELMAEAVAIDARTLSANPYKELGTLLIKGTKNEDLQRIIPEKTVLYDAGIEAGCVVLNFSKDILGFGEDENAKKNIINSIYLTLTELTEVNSVRFLVEGEENAIFQDVYNSKV